MADYKKMYLTALDAIERAMALLEEAEQTAWETGGQGRPPLHPSTERPPCFFSFFPSQCSHWRGNP